MIIEELTNNAANTKLDRQILSFMRIKVEKIGNPKNDRTFNFTPGFNDSYGIKKDGDDVKEFKTLIQISNDDLINSLNRCISRGFIKNKCYNNFEGYSVVLLEKGIKYSLEKD